VKHHIRRSRRAFFHPKAWRIRLLFWAGSIIVGLAAAVFALGSQQADHFFHSMLERYSWLPWVLTPTGLIVIAWLTRNFFPGSQGSGIPQTIAAMEMKSKSAVLSIRIAIGKVILTLLGLGCGASIGREGPTVHIGASLLYAFGRYSKYAPRYMEHGVIIAGGAAGIAAAFNTPLAGIVFAIEELSRSFEERSSGIILMAVVIAGITSTVLLGHYHYFGTFDVSMPDVASWFAVLVCGVLGGVLGGLFSQGLITGTYRLKGFASKHPYFLALLCGLIVAAVGVNSQTSIYGTGYDAARNIIDHGSNAEFDPFFPFAKMLATWASYMSGIPGGIFAPSLATGAGFGADLGHWLPIAPISVMIMLGMVAYFSGVVQSPITAFVIVMEMTNNQQMILAVIATSLIASGASKLVCPNPIYRTLALGFLAEQPPQNRIT
jgi:H+/Cl- antiporter ClcA